ncbi:hypothetical protein PRZ48_006959 [Zasmidium cellare]|uniref:Xaa-Pro dipeptidyl-peptidase C-terminal domain-containing protein n=1 Tax=Zasmidium cellare TaxID=395010 RepID=A0ABR0EIY1_ZASCE|nr:hypothetical protein PRZ48_006959 [Zasmidium cellare]
MPTLPLPKRATIKTRRNDTYDRIKDTYIPTRDGSELCADIFLPLAVVEGAKVPALLSMCPYGKDVHALEWGLPQTDIYAKMNAKIEPLGPDAALEALDPLVWSGELGYAVVRIDSRGVGGTPGMLDPWGLQRSTELGEDAEGNDLYDAIEWTASQPWCSGKVGMSGISYLGMVAWLAAQHQPPSLKAIVPWEAGNDLYFSLFRPGGISNTNFLTHWWNNCVVPYQHGRAEGVSETDLATQRVDFLKSLDWEFRSDGPFPVLERLRGFDKVQIPFYSSTNWMDSEVHAPGNILGYMWAATKPEWKYLETHSGDHINAYYGKDGLERQRRFLGYLLKDSGAVSGGPKDLPKVDLTIRKGATVFRRAEEDFPPPDTEYKEYFFSADDHLQEDDLKCANTDVVAQHEGLTESSFFTSSALEQDLEVLGFPYLELEVATAAKDMDIFVTLINVAPDGNLVVFEGNHAEPSVSVTRGYMRLTHRELDKERSTERLVILAHDNPLPVVPNERYKIKVPIQPTSMIFEKGHKIRIEIGARDSDTLLGVMRHEGGDRTGDRFAGTNTIFQGSKLVLPFVSR